MVQSFPSLSAGALPADLLLPAAQGVPLSALFTAHLARLNTVVFHAFPLKLYADSGSPNAAPADPEYTSTLPLN